MDASIVKQAAQNQWTYILPTLGVSAAHLSNVHGPCPVCGGKDRFKFDDKDGHGTWFCNHCDPQAGDALALLRNIHGWSFPEVLKRVSDVLSLSNNSPGRRESNVYKLRRVQIQKVHIDRYEEIWSLWESGQQIVEGDLAWRYISEARGIQITEFPEALRLQTKQFGYPQLLCAFTDPHNELVQVQGILLTHDAQKAPVEKPKQFQSSWHEGGNSPLRGGAIKLYEPGDELAIGEGVESCLAFYAQYRIPIWAATSKDLLKSVIVPHSVRRVIIAADNDRHKNSDGEKAAEVAARRLVKEGKTVEIWMPETPGHDFADEALAS